MEVSLFTERKELILILSIVSHTHTHTHTHTKHPQHTHTDTPHLTSITRCLGVDNEQTLNNLLDIFTLDTLNVVVAWLSVYWYVPVIVVVVIIILMILLHVTYRKRRPLKRRLSRARNSLRRGRGGAPDAVDADNRGGHRRPGPQRLTQSETSSSFVASPRAVDLNPETLHQKATSYWDIPSDWVFVSIMLRFHVIFLKHR